MATKTNDDPVAAGAQAVAISPPSLADLDGLANRGYTSGFYQRHTSNETQNYLDGHSKSRRSQYVAEVRSISAGWAELDVKNKLTVGDRLEIIHPTGNALIELTELRDGEGAPMAMAAGNGVKASMPMDERFQGALIARLIDEPLATVA